jgi:RNA-binding protein
LSASVVAGCHADKNVGAPLWARLRWSVALPDGRWLRIFRGLAVGMTHTVAMVSLTNAQVREFKAQAQRLKATLKVGKEGLSPQFLAALDEALKHHELLKVKFDALKEQKHELTPLLAEKSGSHLVTRVGNVVVLYRPKMAP